MEVRAVPILHVGQPARQVFRRPRAVRRLFPRRFQDAVRRPVEGCARAPFVFNEPCPLGRNLMVPWLFVGLASCERISFRVSEPKWTSFFSLGPLKVSNWTSQMFFLLVSIKLPPAKGTPDKTAPQASHLEGPSLGDTLCQVCDVY